MTTRIAAPIATELRDRLSDLLAAGTSWPCHGNGEMWLSNDPDERAQVAPLCRTCPVLVACRLEADANDERWGVWAGRDRTPSRRKRAAA